MPRPLRLAGVVGVLVAVPALLLAAPSPIDSVHELRDAAAATDLTAPLVAAAALLAWLLIAWLTLTVLLTLVARVPGATGRVAAGAARRVAPAALRRLAAGLIGVGVVTGSLTGTSAAAAPVPPEAEAGVSAPASLDWPGTAAPVDLDWPDGGAAPTPAPTAPAPEPAPVLGAAVSSGQAADAVVVQPGDTLWGLAEQALEEQQGTAPTDRQVAAAWPSWWAANRPVVGEDPDLLRPGTALQQPEATQPPDPPPPPDEAAEPAP